MENREPHIYRCKASLYPPGLTLAILTGVGLAVMTVTMFIHPILAVVAMVGSMYILMRLMTGPAMITIDANGITRELNVSLGQGKDRKPRTEHFGWDQLQWYKEGRDRGRFSPEYQYVTVHFRNGTEWMITDNNGVRKAEYDVFLREFLQYVEARNRQQIPAKSENTPAPLSSAVRVSQPATGQIERRRTFYETIWAKLFTIALGAVIVFFVFLLVTTSYVGPTSVFKIFVILIPGFLYLWYRVFRDKK